MFSPPGAADAAAGGAGGTQDVLLHVALRLRRAVDVRDRTVPSGLASRVATRRRAGPRSPRRRPRAGASR